MIGGFPSNEDVLAQMHVLEFFTADMETIRTPERYTAVRTAKEELLAMIAGLTGEAARLYGVVLGRVQSALVAYEEADPNMIVCDMLAKSGERKQ